MPCPFATGAQLLYSGLGDVLALTATAPLERLTVLLQASSKDHETTSGLSSSWHRLLWEQGVCALWQGNVVNILYALLNRSLTVYVKDFLWTNHRGWFLPIDAEEEGSSNDDAVPAAAAQTKASLLAGCVSVAVLYPLNYALTNLLAAGDSQHHSKAIHPGPVGVQDGLVRVVRDGGILAMYRGLGMALAGTVSHHGSYLVLYERFVTRRTAAEEKDESDEDRKRSFWKTASGKFVTEQLVSCLACSMAFPYETMSRRLQLQSPADTASIDTVSRVSGDLYNLGIVPRLLRTVLVNSILRLYTSEGSSDFVRRVFMKVFH
jgi:hypothetical protein